MKTIRRRRLEKRTDYKSRLALLKSEVPRLVVRKSNRYVILEIVSSSLSQDKIEVYFNSKSLLDKGWPKELKGSLKSLPASYLSGLALAKLAKSKFKQLILDMGMYRNVPKSRIYACLAGVIAGGIDIAHKPEILPTEQELKRNEKTSIVFDKIKEKI